MCTLFTTVCNSSLTYTTYIPSHHNHSIIPLSNHHTIIILKSIELRNIYINEGQIQRLKVFSFLLFILGFQDLTFSPFFLQPTLRGEKGIRHFDRPLYLSRSKRKHTRSSHHVIMVQLIGNFDFGALCLPTVPWGKSTRKMQFFRKVRARGCVVVSKTPSSFGWGQLRQL